MNFDLFPLRDSISLRLTQNYHQMLSCISDQVVLCDSKNSGLARRFTESKSFLYHFKPVSALIRVKHETFVAMRNCSKFFDIFFFALIPRAFIKASSGGFCYSVIQIGHGKHNYGLV